MVTEIQMHAALTGATWIANRQQVLFATHFVDLLLQPTLLVILLISVQLVLLYLFGVCGTRLLRNCHRQVSQLWLYILCMGLLLIPFHVLVGGWSLEIARPDGVIGSPPSTARVNENGDKQIQNQPIANLAGSKPILKLQLENELDQEADPVATLTAELLTQGARRANFRVQSTQSWWASLNASGKRWIREWFVSRITWDQFLMRTIVGSYIGVVAWFLASNLRGMLWLRSLRLEGQPIDGAAQLNIEAAAKQMQLRKLPKVIECTGLSVPLTCGIFRPLVLVPQGFLTWELEVQQMVLLHEFAHVRRGDLVGELLARALTILFWFHPASWLIVRQQRAARELSTDELVVVTGSDRFRYANCLVSVIERMSQMPRVAKSLPAVAMSTSRNIELRILALVDCCRAPARNARLMWIVVALINLSMFGSSFRLQTPDSAQAQAADRQSEENDTQDAPLLTVEATGVLRFNADRLQSSVSLIERIEDCMVTPVATVSHGPIFNINGVVKNPDGSPAVDATVILRESPQMRVSSDPKLLERSDRHLLAVPDVFAKTKTDSLGRYEFKDVKSPELPSDRFQNTWDWSAIAVSDDCLGVQQLDPARTPIKTIAQANIQLEKTQSIRATVVNAHGDAVLNAIVHLSGLARPGQRNPVLIGGQLEREFVTWMSVFTPMVRADASGEVAFSHVPVSRVAILVATHPDYVGGSGRVATSDDVTLGEAARPPMQNNPRLLTQASPAKIEMEVGQRLRGRVLVQGKPVADVKVGLSSSVPRTKTDSTGSFELRYSAFQAPAGQIQIVLIPPEGSNLLYRDRIIDTEELDAKEPIDIELFQGVRIVGKVLCNGKPAPNILVAATHVPGESNWMYRGSSSTQEGTFEFVVPPHATKVFLTTDEPGFKLARTVEGRAAREGTVPEGWPQKDVPISEADAGQTIELEPFIVDATDSIAIQAGLPNGEPARQGVVTVKDKSLRHPEYPDAIGIPTTLDEDGRTQLKLPGIPSGDAYIEVRLSTEAGGFAGRKLLREIGADGVLTVELQAGMLVRGTVLLNGQPIGGARVTISKAEPANERGMFRTIPLATVETNEGGVYSAGVERVSQYSVSVQSVPGVPDQPYEGYSAQPSDSNVIEVSPFDYQTGSEEIQGVVLDANRRPLEGVSVGVESKSQPGGGRPLLLGWRSASQLTTDKQGRFILRNLPKGEYQIRANSQQNGQGRNLNAEVEAAAGDKNVKIFIETNQAPPTPRLQVQSISDY